MYITGTAQLFAKQITVDGKSGETFVSYSISVSTKDKDEKYVNTSIPVVISKEAKKALANIPFKDIQGAKNPTRYYKVDLEDAWFTVRLRKSFNEPAIFINKVSSFKAINEDVSKAPW